MRNLDQLNRVLEPQTPQQIITWAFETYGPQVAVSSSFQTQSVPLLYMVAQIAPQIPILFLETGYHFPETLEFRDQLVSKWGLNIHVVSANLSRETFIQQHGNDLYRRNPDLCCQINKIEPLARALECFQAWITGIRRDQATTRADAQILEHNAQGILRIHPMAAWTRQDITHYIETHHLPQHPLITKGYRSIGCAPCTRPVALHEDERNGRWVDQTKTECGLHTVLRRTD